MSRRSLESQERPIMAASYTSKRASTRYSTYSASPSFATTATSNTITSSTPLSPSARASSTADHYTTSSSAGAGGEIADRQTSAAGMAEIKQLTQGLDRLENKRLAQQRFVPSERKSDEISKLALGAKLERALGRRMADQDAVLRVKVKKGGAMNEKVGEIKA